MRRKRRRQDRGGGREGGRGGWVERDRQVMCEWIKEGRGN